jgi:hypothetical protein
MALTAFTSRLGLGQGRLATPKATSSNHAFVLGDDESGHFFELAPGDHAEVTQEADLTGVMLVRALLRLRVPSSTPLGFAWEASIVVDGIKLTAMRAKTGRDRLVTDLAANVSKLSGRHSIGVRLELVSA